MLRPDALSPGLRMGASLLSIRERSFISMLETELGAVEIDGVPAPDPSYDLHSEPELLSALSRPPQAVRELVAEARASAVDRDELGFRIPRPARRRARRP